MKRLFEIDPWKLVTHQLIPTEKRLQESLTAIGNGYMGMRGNFEEGYSGDHHLGTYYAGVWYPDKTRVGWWKNGYPDYFGKVINGVNFAGVAIRLNDLPVDLAQVPYDDFYLELDMQTGILQRNYTVELGGARVRFTFERFLSIVKKELGAVKITAEVLTGAAVITMTSKLDSDVTNEDSNYEEHFWEEIAAGQVSGFDYLTVRTIPNNFGIERFTITAAMQHNAKGSFTQEALKVSETFTWQLAAGESCELVKTVLVVTSRDVPESKQVAKIKELYQAYGTDYEALKTEQIAAWGQRWELADVEIAGDAEAQQGIRFNLFQLFATYYGEDSRLNIGPKGFTGEKYGGATYWDTEAYVIPMYLSVAQPAVTKKLLEYRLNQLPGAHINAQRQGLKGALYPMVTFTGVECHNEWEITFEELHRNGAIIHAIYNYTTYTGDESYRLGDGLAVIVEVARFWADRVHYSKAKDCYMLHGVTGPNEYENNVNNNWYTNYMARWILNYAHESVTLAEGNPLAVTPEELATWQEIAAKMYLPEDEERGIFVQHDTFLDKELLPTTALDPSERPLNQHWSWDKILRSCFIKQADVLQAMYFFPENFTKAEKERNFDFYEPMTVHESSLSPCVHAIIAAELGRGEKAVEMYKRTARLDLDNYNNDTEDGLHITSMSGSWLAIVRGFAGMRTVGGLHFAPFCPADWSGYRFRVNYRGRLLDVQVRSDLLTLTLKAGAALAVTVFDQEIDLQDTVTLML